MSDKNSESDNVNLSRMDRRQFLTIGGISAITALSGCSTSTQSTKDPTEAETRQKYDPDPQTSDSREWEGGRRNTQEQGAAIYTDGVRISVPFSYASSQIGVYFGDRIDGNIENISDEDFDWVEARDSTYIWTPYVEIRSEESEYRMEPENLPEEIPPERWSARAEYEGDQVLPYATGFDEVPTYYRFVTQGGTETSRAYTTPGQSGRGGRYLAFELASRWIWIEYNGDARAEWVFDF